MTGQTLFEQPPDLARFDGPEPEAERLRGQIKLVWMLMSDGKWRTIGQMRKTLLLCNVPENSIQAQLRNLRKERFGAFLVERRRTAEGLYEYRVGAKGEGIPQHARCNNCETLEARIVELEAQLVRQASRVPL
jgi:hypothetical protein